MEWTELEEKAERALLVSLDTGEYDAQASLDELYELVRSAGADPVLSVTQKRPAPDTAFCVGTIRLRRASSPPSKAPLRTPTAPTARRNGASHCAPTSTRCPYRR